MIKNNNRIIRQATGADSAALTRMVRESSAYTGEYRKIVENIEISPAQIARDTVYVCEVDGQVAGFYSLKRHEGSIELDYMFVDNTYTGSGVGRLLFEHMLDEAKQLGYSEVEIIAHPPAEAFYAKMGAGRVGMQPPAGRVTWERPRMLVKVQ